MYPLRYFDSAAIDSVLPGRLSTQIATAAEQQSAVTEEINRSMVQIRHMVDELVKSGQASELNTQQLLEANSRVSAIMGRFKVR